MEPRTDYPGLFISVEGVDGAGKSTLVQAAERQLDNVLTTREPAEHLWTGRQVRRAIDDPASAAATDFHMFLADRAYHLEQTILPALQDGMTVISDRYSDSTRAYQKVILEGAVQDPEAFIDFNLKQPWHIEPDMTILLDIGAEESALRTSEGDKYEESSFIKSVRQNYLELASDNPRIVTLDGSQPSEMVNQVALALMEQAQREKVGESDE